MSEGSCQECGAPMNIIEALEQDVAKASEKLEQAVEEILAMTRANDDLNTIAKFWRQAAEHAVAGWNALEDTHAETLRIARAGLEKAEAYISLCKCDICGDDEPEVNDDQEQVKIWQEQLTALEGPTAPDETPTPGVSTVDMGDGIKLRVVEDETPID